VTAAAAPLRRNLTSTELAAHTDFERMQSTWESAVDAVLADLVPVFASQGEDITAQISVAAKADDLTALDSVTVDEQAAYEVLAPALLAAAQSAAQAQQKEAEDQGVTVPEWSLTADTVTAAAGRDLLDSVARVTARLMATSLVQSAVRTAAPVRPGYDTGPGHGRGSPAFGRSDRRAAPGRGRGRDDPGPGRGAKGRSRGRPSGQVFRQRGAGP
jgi:hypothetical protein